MVASFKRNSDHLVAGQFAAFANGIGDFAGFAQTNTHTAPLVANDHQRAEIEAASAFDDFGGAVDEDNLLVKFLRPRRRIQTHRSRRPAAATTATRAGARAHAAAFGATVAAARRLRFWLFQPQYFLLVKLKLQSGFARGIGQGFDFAVITRAAAIKHDLL